MSSHTLTFDRLLKMEGNLLLTVKNIVRNWNNEELARLIQTQICEAEFRVELLGYLRQFINFYNLLKLEQEQRKIDPLLEME